MRPIESEMKSITGTGEAVINDNVSEISNDAEE
jgi:hypothetical protein